MRIFNRRAWRIKPILDIHCSWTMIGSTYPEQLMIAMRDGHVVKYDINVRPIRIHTGKNGWDMRHPQVVGYKYQWKRNPLKRVGSSLKRWK